MISSAKSPYLNSVENLWWKFQKKIYDNEIRGVLVV